MIPQPPSLAGVRKPFPVAKSICTYCKHRANAVRHSPMMNRQFVPGLQTKGCQPREFNSR